METKGRALFNLIRMNWLEDTSLPIESWQVETYRSFRGKELFEKLRAIDISLDEKRFLEYGENCSSPEELTQILWVGEEDPTKFDQAYLLLFELWRRLLPERQSLSIFCDELDHLIDLYDQGNLTNEEPLQDALVDLERILDEHVDHGDISQETFYAVSQYCAHDLESFIYDYASKQIVHQNPLYASELVDGFYPYVSDVIWFDFLRLRFLFDTDSDEAKMMLSHLLERLREAPNFELLLEIARFLVNRGAVPFFLQTVRQARSVMQTEQDFQELLAISCEFFRLLDREEEKEKVCAILQSRKGNGLDQKLPPNDQILKTYYELFNDLDRYEI